MRRPLRAFAALALTASLLGITAPSVAAQSSPTPPQDPGSSYLHLKPTSSGNTYYWLFPWCSR